MSADGSDGDTKTKSTRRSGRPKKPRVVPEDEISGDGKSDEDFDEPFEGSEEDDDFEEEARPPRKKPAGRAKAATATQTPAAKAKTPAKGKKASKDVEEDEEDEDVDGDLEDDEEDVEGEEDEDEEDFSEEDSEEEGGGGKKKNGGAKKKKDKNADPDASSDRAQYFPNASFVIAKKDKDSTNKVDLELWRIDGKCMLQKFIGYTDDKDSQLKFKSTNAYTGWSALDKDDYMNVNVVIDPSSTQSKVIVTVDPDGAGAADVKTNDVDIAIEDVK